MNILIHLQFDIWYVAEFHAYASLIENFVLSEVEIDILTDFGSAMIFHEKREGQKGGDNQKPPCSGQLDHEKDNSNEDNNPNYSIDPIPQVGNRNAANFDRDVLLANRTSNFGCGCSCFWSWKRKLREFEMNVPEIPLKEFKMIVVGMGMVTQLKGDGGFHIHELAFSE